MRTRLQFIKPAVLAVSLLGTLAFLPACGYVTAAPAQTTTTGQTELQVAATPQTKLEVNANGAPKAATTVQTHITVYDEDGKSVLVEARKRLAQGSNAFDVLRSMIALEFITFPKLGSFVTSLAGLKAGNGFFWELSVDGKPSQVGIGDIKIEKDIEIVWRLKPAGGN